MNCSCNQNAKVKPTEFCSFCIHKHLSTALALSEYVNVRKQVLDYRIAAQVNLAVFHLLGEKKSHLNEIEFCRKVIYRILKKEEFIEDLKLIVSHFWNKAVAVPHVESAEELSQDSLDFIVLKLSIVIELLKYEHTYENVNYSTAIGQLVMASWALNRIDNQLGEQCRNLYHDIENGKADIEKIESFRLQIFNKYI